MRKRLLRKGLTRKNLVFIIIASCLAITALCLIIVLTSGNDENFARIDVDEYYKDNSEKVVATIKVHEAKTVLTESEAQILLMNRGFDNLVIFAQYDLDGRYIGSNEINPNGTTKYPMYEATYLDKQNAVWTLMIINGQITAYPVSYNMNSNGTPIIVSEEETLMSYDAGTSKFYETIPKGSSLSVKVVDRIDTEMLENMTEEALSQL